MYKSKSSPVTFKVTVEREVFKNDNNGFGIYATKADMQRYPFLQSNKYGNISIKGYIAPLTIGVEYEVTATGGEGKYGYGSAWDSAYVYNELSQFINFFGGSYYDWQNPNTKEALSFLYNMAADRQTPVEQVTDQYEQLEQKFLEGAYASIFAYSGTMNTFVRAGVYREDFIQVAPLPEFAENTTNIAAWQYVLNKASVHKEAAFRFLEYAASREGSIAYSEYMNRLPARLDIIREEDLDIPGFGQLRDYVENTRLRERPFSRNTMEDITSMGTLFQRYVLEEITQEEFCQKAQNITDNF